MEAGQLRVGPEPEGEEAEWGKDINVALLVRHLFSSVQFRYMLYCFRHVFINTDLFPPPVFALCLPPLIVATRAPSWILGQAENLASFSLQDGATKWYYFLVWTTYPPTHS